MRNEFSRPTHIIPQSLPSEATSFKAQLDKAISDLEHSLNGKYATEYQLKKIESSIRGEVQTHFEAAKVEHKKQVEQLNNDMHQKLEKLKVDSANLSHQKDPYMKATYLSSPVKVDAPSVSYKEELSLVEKKFNESLSYLATRIDSSYDLKLEELRSSLSQ